MASARSLLALTLFALTVLPGCALFRSSLREQLLPYEMVRVEGGTFWMGDFYEASNEDALPIHRVTVEPFEIGRYEVTYAQYDAFATATERPLPDDDGYGRGDRAVAHVTWDEAAAFCEAYGYRLPTEAEWEYAARSGGQEQLYAGTDSTEALGRYARYADNSVGFGSQVGRRAPNALGLYDMSGNVAEWVGAYYQFYPEPDSLPVYSDLETRGVRIVRGGHFAHPENINRTYWRTGTLRDVETFSIGFRCASDE